ncbi:MAG: hypothetical protein HN348_09005 [Proteobacteria bacterium]|jgi:hypothetical protein|nr:hypothetical protein [Pseudomonadota bacterium]
MRRFDTKDHLAMIRKAVGAIVRVRGSEAETILLEMLKWNNGRQTAIKHLAEVGTVRAVPLLSPLADAGLVVSNEERMAQKAIQAIQSRLGDVEAGGLSVASLQSEAGGLSVAAENGRLSIAKKQNAR